MTEKGQFTPFQSPGTVPGKNSRKSGQRNLTGNVRKLKDIAADLHNSLEKWDSLNTQGHSILNDIVNFKLQYIYQHNEDSEVDGEQMSVSTLSRNLEPKCEALLHVIESLEGVVSKLSSLSSVVQGIHTLSVHRGESDNILFSSWTIHQFADTLDTLHAMYAKELNLKRALCENVAHADSRPSLMFYSAAWLHQPYVDSKVMVMALLQETGHCS